ncbi:MAG: phosphotransferase family protein [Gammaproteobacteria bacterium]|nr:phosphotransferase family protein [Gammaproteobacteria bacterium]
MAELAPDVAQWISSVTRGRITRAQRILAGGRFGWYIDVEDRAGTVHELFLQQSRSDAGDPGRSPFNSFRMEGEIYRALHRHIPVPRPWGINEQIGGFLVDRVPGVAWMHPPADPGEQLSVAQDFIRHIAKLHTLDPGELDLPSYHPVKSAREHQLDRLGVFRAQAEAGGEPIEPMLRISLEFLENSIPDYDGPVVLVQGDTGPGNLMYRNGRVTGIIDWELAHLSDPMDDIAWMCWRTVQHTFTDFAERMREYEALSGHRIDVDRVNYYRVNAFVVLCAVSSSQAGGFGLSSMTEASGESKAARSAIAESERDADGSAFAMTALHRRMRITALADALGIALPPRQVRGEAPVRPEYSSYDDLLEQMRVIVPEIGDAMATRHAKGVVRKLKHLKELSRNGALFDRFELDRIASLLGRRPESLGKGRAALYQAAVARDISDEDYILYHWDRLVHDEHLMQYAAGTLSRRDWPALH